MGVHGAVLVDAEALAGEDHTYVTDFFDVRGLTVYEVKHAKELGDPVVVAKVEAARAWCEQRGFTFVTVTEADLVGYLMTRKQVRELPGVELCS